MLQNLSIAISAAERTTTLRKAANATSRDAGLDRALVIIDSILNSLSDSSNPDPATTLEQIRETTHEINSGLMSPFIDRVELDTHSGGTFTSQVTSNDSTTIRFHGGFCHGIGKAKQTPPTLTIGSIALTPEGWNYDSMSFVIQHGDIHKNARMASQSKSLVKASLRVPVINESFLYSDHEEVYFELLLFLE